MINRGIRGLSILKIFDTIGMIFRLKMYLKGKKIFELFVRLLSLIVYAGSTIRERRIFSKLTQRLEITGEQSLSPFIVLMI